MKTPIPFSLSFRPAGWLFACICVAGVIFPSDSGMAQSSSQKYVAIITSNVNVDGVSLRKGSQLEAVDYDRVSEKVIVSQQGGALKVPGIYVRVVPQEKAGITVVRAEYGTPGQKAKNVTAVLQRKLDGQQKASFVVSAADYGVRNSGAQGAPASGGMNQGGGGAQAMSGGAMQGGMMAPQGRAALTVEFYYNGTGQTASAPEGQTLAIPVP